MPHESGEADDHLPKGRRVHAESLRKSGDQDPGPRIPASTGDQRRKHLTIERGELRGRDAGLG